MEYSGKRRAKSVSAAKSCSVDCASSVAWHDAFSTKERPVPAGWSSIMNVARSFHAKGLSATREQLIAALALAMSG